MYGEIIAQKIVSIHKKGSLEGNVTAKAITVEKGGIFSGQLVIGQAAFTQGELLPERKLAAANTAEPDISDAAPHPLTATYGSARSKDCIHAVRSKNLAAAWICHV